MALHTYISAITEALREEMQRDERVFLIGEGIGRSGKPEPASAKNTRKKAGVSRVVEAALADGMIVSSAVGAAIAGMRPVSHVPLALLTERESRSALRQAATLRYRSGGTQCCPITLRVPYGDDATQQTDTRWLCHEAGLLVVAPSSAADARGMLKAAIRQDDPVVYLEHRMLYQSAQEELSDDPEAIADLHKAAVRREGQDLTVVSYGYMLQAALEAAEKLSSSSGASIEVIDLRILNPLDHETILKSISKTSKLCIVQEDRHTLGVGAEIAATAAELAFDCLEAPILRVSTADTPVIPFAPPLREMCLPSAAKIEAAYLKLLSY